MDLFQLALDALAEDMNGVSEYWKDTTEVLEFCFVSHFMYCQTLHFLPRHRDFPVRLLVQLRQHLRV
jgi:hypothetical protein